ncbi:hypothetical protein [Tenacibaculum aiptasiae]|uniref:hypothetical protein n=1 Tax=Tenacibaculum aiptasiae TaxID=426481 RepID=UPI003B5CD0F4
MQKFNNVEHTKPYQLFFLLVSTVGVFALVIFFLNKIMELGLLKLILAVIIAWIYFIFLKKKFIVKKSDFYLRNNKLEWDTKKVIFSDIKSYKIHWLKGAGLKIKLKNGKTIRLSSNDNFCNSNKFVNLCRNIDSKLLKYKKGQVVREKTFFETKKGYYFAVIVTVLIVIITIHKLFTDGNFDTESIGLLMVSLGTIWSGVRWNKKKHG